MRLSIFIIWLLILCFWSVGSVRNQLMDAAIIADVEKVRYLLSLDASILSPNQPLVVVNAKDENFGRTAIMVAHPFYI